MNNQYLDIKDQCRKNLLPFLTKALSQVPSIENGNFLDVGCGTGLPALAIAEKYSNCHITAIDSDIKSIDKLKKRLSEHQRLNQFTLVNRPFSDADFEAEQFDLILAEGFLNIVGFNTGFPQLLKLLKPSGYFIIHDEFQDHEEKLTLIRSNNCQVISTDFINHHIWKEHYIKGLETEISEREQNGKSGDFELEKQEIEWYSKNPTGFNSIYYVVKKL